MKHTPWKTAVAAVAGTSLLLGLGACGRSEDKPAGEAVVTVPPEQQEEVAQDIEASMAKIFEPEAEAPASSADLGDTRAFDQIQFGKDYEIE